jgi:predicted O-methyltransferase YrrM
LESFLCPPDANLDRARRESVVANLPPVSVSELQGRQLNVLAQIAGAARILEVGTLGGHSTLWLAKALPADGEMVTVECNPVHASVARTTISESGFDDRVTVREGDAVSVLQQMVDGGEDPFDFFFVDADQHNNVNYFNSCMALARSGSVFVLDNVVRGGEVSLDDLPNPAVEATQTVLAMIKASAAIDGVVFQTVGRRGHDGMLVVRVR